MKATEGVKQTETRPFLERGLQKKKLIPNAKAYPEGNQLPSLLYI